MQPRHRAALFFDQGLKIIKVVCNLGFIADGGALRIRQIETLYSVYHLVNYMIY